MSTLREAGSPHAASFNEAQEYLGQKSKRKDDQLNNPELTPAQKKKQDALDLAELIYDIFKASMSNASIEEKSVKEKNNA